MKVNNKPSVSPVQGVGKVFHFTHLLRMLGRPLNSNLRVTQTKVHITVVKFAFPPQCAVHLHNESSSGRCLASSEDELENNEKDGGGGAGSGGGGALGFSSSGMEDDNQGGGGKTSRNAALSYEICIQVQGTVGIGYCDKSLIATVLLYRYCIQGGSTLRLLTSK